MKFFATLSLAAITTFQASAAFESDIFTVEDPNGNVTVSLSGDTWCAREVRDGDIPSYQALFGDPVVMANYGNGKVRTPEYVEGTLTNMWLPRFANGHPHGSLSVFNTTDPSVDPQFMGFIVAGGGDGPGVSEVAYAYHTDFWGQGYGTALLKSVVETWAPEVRRVGLGVGLDPQTDQAIIDKFKCFGGEVLYRMDATASPSNPGSWKVLTKVGFTNASTGVASIDEYILDMDGSDALVEDCLQPLFDASQSDTPLLPNTRYLMVDGDGNLQTVSYKNRWECFKYHFELQLGDRVQ